MDSRDAVLVPRSGYPLFEYLAGLECVSAQSYPLHFDGSWWLDLAAIRARLAQGGPRVRALILVHPGNPTGAYASAAQVHELAQLCAAHGVALISDEVFSDYALRPVALPSLLHTRDALAFCLGGLSKSLALPQLKLGWLHIGGPPALAREARRRLEVIADTWLPVGTPVQLAAPRLLARADHVQEPIRARVRTNLLALAAAIPPGAPLSLLPVEGGWYAILRVPAVQGDEAWALELLEAEDVLVQPGHFFDFEQPGHLVLSLLPEPGSFADAAHRLVSRICRSGV